MTSRPLMIRAAGRVLVRVLAKAFAYGVIVASAVWLLLWSDVAFMLVIVCWAIFALAVFCDKVREEAQRIRGRS